MRRLTHYLWLAVLFSGWGFSTSIMAITGKQMNIVSALFCNLLGMALVNAFFLSELYFALTWGHMLGILAGALITLADLAYYKLAESGMDVSVIGPVSSLYILIPALIGLVFYREPLSLRKLLGRRPEGESWGHLLQPCLLRTS
jgi:drug/metabolite transporter (DMT)-like permease